MDAWCERRAIKTLGHFLPGYVAFERRPENMLPLAVALQDVAHFENEVLESEKAEIISLLGCVRSFIRGGFRV